MCGMFYCDIAVFDMCSVCDSAMSDTLNVTEVSPVRHMTWPEALGQGGLLAGVPQKGGTEDRTKWRRRPRRKEGKGPFILGIKIQGHKASDREGEKKAGLQPGTQGPRQLCSTSAAGSGRR